MTAKQALSKIGALLKINFSSDQAFEEAKLSDGTVISYSVLEPAGDIFIIDAEGNQQPAPAGELELEDGRIVVITEPGKIAEVKDAAEPPAEEEMNQDPVDYAPQIAELKKENADLKSRLDALEAAGASFKKSTGVLLEQFHIALQAVAEEDTDEPAKNPKQTIFSEQQKKKAEAKKKAAEGFAAFAAKMNPKK